MVLKRCWSLFMAVLLCTLFILPAAVSAAGLSKTDSDALNGPWENWVPDDGSGSASSCSVNLSGNSNEPKVVNFFISQLGLTPAQAAGFAANIKAESHYEPRLVEYGYPNSSGQISEPGQPSSLDDNVPPDANAKGQPGYGIIQWSGGRKLGLKNFAAQKNMAVNDLGLQLLFVQEEVTTTYKLMLNQLKAASDPAAAADIVMNGYEVPGDTATQGPIREGFARDIATQFGSSNSTAAQPPITSSTPTSSCVGDVSGYQNPLRDIKNLSPARIDEGVDYVGDGPVYALGPGKVIYASTSTGWPGGNFVSYTLNDGPAAGKAVYVAENCDVQVSVGDSVDSSTVVCNMHSSYPYIETGWAVTNPQDLAAAYQNYNTGAVPDGSATNFGQNFDTLMRRLGAPAGTYDNPSQKGQNVGTPLPQNWPQW